MSLFARVAGCLLIGAVAGMASTPLRAETADLKALATPLNIDPRSVSVSGVSAGASMAQQFQIVYSQWIIGAGIIAGGPYGCAQHQPHGTPPLVLGPIANSIAWGVNYCSSYAEVAAEAYGIGWLANFMNSNYYLISDKPFGRNGRCPTSRHSLRVPLNELTDETSIFDPRHAAIAACPEPTCSLDPGREVKYRNNPHDFACLLANATLYDHEHRYLSDNIKKAKFFMLRGSHDAKVPLRTSDALYQYYRILGVPAENILYIRNDPPVRHALLINDPYKFWEQASGEDATLLRKHINRCNEPVDPNVDTYLDSCSCSTLSTMAASVCANGAGEEFCEWNNAFMGEHCALGDDAESPISDVAGALLKQIYEGNTLCGSGACSRPWQERKPLVQPNSLSLADMLKALESKVTAFDQRPFLSDENYSRSSLSDYGFIYIPPQCADGTTQCRLHIAFHGCAQGDVQSNPFVMGRPEETRKNFAAHGGYNELAISNDMIVLYPQVRTSMPSLSDPSAAVNAFGCSD